METLLQDVRYGIRMLVKNPGFTAVAVLTLALGIGANTAIFSVVNSVLLRPLPYSGSERLVILNQKSPQMEMSISLPDYADWREQQQSFESMAIFQRANFNLTGAGEAERLQGRRVEHTFFRTFGADIAVGRDFRADEDKAGAAPAAILAHGLWERRFGADPKVIDQVLILNGRAHTVIGVAPKSFVFSPDIEIYAPIGLDWDRMAERGNHPGAYAVGRLKPGVSMEKAMADMNTIAARIEKEHPKTNYQSTVMMRSMLENSIGDIGQTLWVLFAAVGFVLLIACANMANLMLARAATRNREVAVRTALGASRRRIVLQLLIEAVMLAVAGGMVGLLLAYWGIDLLKTLFPASLPRITEIAIDGRVLGFSLLVSLLTGILFGVVPALRASQVNLSEVLKEGSAGSGTGLHTQRFRRVLIAGEMAVALVLLIAAGLTIKSFLRMQAVDPGFDPNNLLTFRISMHEDRYKGQQVPNFLAAVRERLMAVPGITTAAATTNAPLLFGRETSVRVEGSDVNDPASFHMSAVYQVGPGYLETAGLRLLKGRFLSGSDQANTPRVMVIDRKLADKVYPGQEVIGKRLEMGDEKISIKLEIVGLVEHVKQYALDGPGPVEAQFYTPISQVPEQFLGSLGGAMNFVVRTEREASAMVPAIRAAIREIDPEQPIFGITGYDEVLADAMATRRFTATLLGVFAGVALALASVGIYGVIAYSVAQRTREIGLRMALGASRLAVFRMLLGQAALLVVIGLSSGFAIALLMSRVMQGLLFGVSATDPPTFALMSVVLGVVALLASLAPAQRATRVDPMVALRYE